MRDRCARKAITGILVAVAMGGCATGVGEIERPSEHAATAAQANLHFRDEMDGGDDIWDPGCHFEYSDAACTLNRRLLAGDFCRTWKVLAEWTLRECHGATGDQLEIDCDDECKRRGFQRGFCQTVPGHCAPGRDSARCTCAGPPPPNPTLAGAGR